MTPPDPAFHMTLDGLLKLWQLIGTPVIGIMTYYVRDVSKQLRAMNGRITTLQAETKAHERELDQLQRDLRGRWREGGP